MKFPGDLTQTKWINACKRLGLEINTKGGKGSHIKVSCKGKGATIVPIHINQMINKSLGSTLQKWGFSEEQIREALDIK